MTMSSEISEKVDKDAIALTSDDRASCLVTCVAMEQLLDEQDYDPYRLLERFNLMTTCKGDYRQNL